MLRRASLQNYFQYPTILFLLPYSFGVMNTTQLLYEIQEVPFDVNLKLASLYVTNMHTNVPKKKKKDKLYMMPSSIIMSTLTMATKFYQYVMW